MEKWWAWQDSSVSSICVLWNPQKMCQCLVEGICKKAQVLARCTDSMGNECLGSKIQEGLYPSLSLLSLEDSQTVSPWGWIACPLIKGRKLKSLHSQEPGDLCELHSEWLGRSVHTDQPFLRTRAGLRVQIFRGHISRCCANARTSPGSEGLLKLGPLGTWLCSPYPGPCQEQSLGLFWTSVM